MCQIKMKCHHHFWWHVKCWALSFQPNRTPSTGKTGWLTGWLTGGPQILRQRLVLIATMGILQPRNRTHNHTHTHTHHAHMPTVQKRETVGTSDISCTCHISMSLYFGKQFQLIHNQCTNVLSIINCWRFISQCSNENNNRGRSYSTQQQIVQI